MTMSTTFPKLEEAQKALAAKRADLFSIFEEAGPDHDMDKIKSLSGDSKAKVEEIQKRNREIDELAAEVAQMSEIKRIADRSREAGEGEGGADEEDRTKGRQPSHKSLGRAFVESEAFKGYKPGQGVGPSARLDVDLKTLFESAAGWDPEALRTGRVELLATRPAPHVIDAFPMTTTKFDTVKYMEETTFTNNAAEAAAGAAYGEAALALTERTQLVEKIAVFIPVTDEQFEDEERSRAYVDRRLRFMLSQRIDSQALVGDGTTPNLKGTENVSGIQTQAKGADPIFDAAYKLFRKIQDDGFAQPSAFFIRPSKWEEVALTRTADGLYILGHPSQEAPVRLWGVPGVLTTAVTATKLVAGDYANYAELVTRRGVDVQVSNSHSDFFAKGKLAVRADVRLAVVHFRPKAFGACTGL
jgi:hypothetical protein